MNDYARILIWDAHTRMGHNIVPYAYGISHTRMGRPIRVWDNIRIWGRTALKAFSCTFACLYKKGHNFSMPARTDLNQKGFYSIQNSDSFELCHKAVCVTVCSLLSLYIIFVILKTAKWRHF